MVEVVKLEDTVCAVVVGGADGLPVGPAAVVPGPAPSRPSHAGRASKSARKSLRVVGVRAGMEEAGTAARQRLPDGVF